MKTNLLFIAAIWLLSFVVIHAQNPSISNKYKTTVGTPYKIMDGHTKLLYGAGDGIHAIKVGINKYGNKNVSIQKYNLKTGKEVKRETYSDLKGHPLFVKMAQLKDRLYYIYEGYNKKTKLSTLYALEVNLKEGTFLTEREVFTTTKPIRYMLLPYEDVFLANRKFQSTISQDASKIAFFYLNDSPVNNDHKNYETYSFRVFDEDLEAVLSKEVKMPYSEAQSEITSIGVSNTGSAYMLFAQTKEKRLEVVQVTENKNHFIKVGLDRSAAFNRFVFTQKKNGNILCAGAYDKDVSTSGKSHGRIYAEGIYTFELAEDSPEIINPKTYDIPKKYLKDYEITAKNPGASSLDIHTINTNEDGSIEFITEQQRTDIGDGKIYYYYDDIIIWSVDASGEQKWVKRVAKTQHITGGYKEPISFKHFKEGDTHYLFHYEKMKRKIYLTVFEVDNETGEYKKHTLLDMEHMDDGKIKTYEHQVRYIFKVGEKTFVAEAYAKKKNDVMVRIDRK